MEKKLRVDHRQQQQVVALGIAAEVLGVIEEQIAVLGVDRLAGEESFAVEDVADDDWRANGVAIHYLWVDSDRSYAYRFMVLPELIGEYRGAQVRVGLAR